MTAPQSRIPEAKAAIKQIQGNLRRHRRMLADAKRDREPADELRQIKGWIKNDHAFIASWERVIKDEEQKASDPALLALRRRVDDLGFMDCVALISSNDQTMHLWIPANTTDGLTHLRETVFEQVRRGILAFPSEAAAAH